MRDTASIDERGDRKSRLSVTGLVVLSLLCAAGARAQSQTLLHQLFRDHSVLQRDRPIAVWGQAESGEAVTVSLGSSSARVQADAAGRWSAVLPAMSAGGPFVLRAQGSSGATQSANDVLVGDVFLCSGQSNMELPVLRADNNQGEIASSANNTIRMLTVEQLASPTPQALFPRPVTWQIASAETVPKWSAVCFFFARELQRTVHVPIGLVHSSWGGSNIRPWMSAEALRSIGGYESALDVLALYARDRAAAQSRFAAQWEAWWREKSGDRVGAEPWSANTRALGPADAKQERTQSRAFESAGRKRRRRLSAIGQQRQRATLSNGLKGVLAERHHVPVVQLNLMVDAGHAMHRLGSLSCNFSKGVTVRSDRQAAPYVYSGPACQLRHISRS